MEKNRAQRNRTITLTEEERIQLRKSVVVLNTLRQAQGPQGSLSLSKGAPLDCTINADLLQALPLLPDAFADLIIIDPPYNLTKDFNGNKFNARSQEAYDEYLASWFPQVCKKLKPNGSLYL